MGITQTFCQALREEVKAYQTNKTQRRKKLNPIREQDIVQLTQLLETAEKQIPTNILVLHRDVVNFLSSMKTLRLIGVFPIASDLRIQLSHVLTQPQFDPTQMVIVELQEQQLNQCHINQTLHTNLTLHQQEINLLKTNLRQRDTLCEALKTRCSTLELENEQLKESLKACADETTAERFNQLHQQVVEQQTTNAQLTRDHEKVKSDNHDLKAENKRLREKNRKLKNAARENAPSSTNQPSEAVYYPSPLKNTASHPHATTTSTTPSNLVTTIEFKT